MAVRLVHIHVKPEHIDAFLEVTRRNHEGSVAEPGNLRFDVLRSADDPTRFLLYEWYATDEAALAHRETPHFQHGRPPSPTGWSSRATRTSTSPSGQSHRR